VTTTDIPGSDGVGVIGSKHAPVSHRPPDQHLSEPAHPEATEALASWWAVVYSEQAWRRALMPPVQVAYCVDCRFAESSRSVSGAGDVGTPVVCISRDEVRYLLSGDSIALNAQLHEADMVNGAPLGTAAAEVRQRGADHDSVLTFVDPADKKASLFSVPSVGTCDAAVAEVALYGVILSSCRHACNYTRLATSTAPACEHDSFALAYLTIQARLRTLQMARIYGGRTTAAALLRCSSVLGSCRICIVASCCAALALATSAPAAVSPAAAQPSLRTQQRPEQGSMKREGFCTPIVCSGTFEVFSESQVVRETRVMQDLLAFIDHVSAVSGQL